MSDDWYTPRYIFDALGCSFDLDVAAPIEGPRYVPAAYWYHQDGLAQPWFGFVWMNPPYGHNRDKLLWGSKFFEHGDGIALLPDRTSAPWWQHLAPHATAICFVNGKIKFERPDGSRGEQPGNGTCLFAAGSRGAEILQASGLGFVTCG